MPSGLVYLVESGKLSVHPQEYMDFLNLLNSVGCTDLGVWDFNKESNYDENMRPFNCNIDLILMGQPHYSSDGTFLYINTKKYHLFAVPDQLSFDPKEMTCGLDSIAYSGRTQVRHSGLMVKQ